MSIRTTSAYISILSQLAAPRAADGMVRAQFAMTDNACADKFTVTVKLSATNKLLEFMYTEGVGISVNFASDPARPLTVDNTELARAHAVALLAVGDFVGRRPVAVSVRPQL